MEYQHKSLANGRWQKPSFFEQMANIGSEVERALELLDLTVDNEKNGNHLRELLRLREVLVDYFAFENICGSSDQKWHNYFYAFSFAARLNH